ncbi:MAG: hypothetical protein AABX70_05840 [Nanoarchaeota archaeon]
MSYVRFNEPLRYFKGSSASYVFTSGGKLTKKGWERDETTYTEDYDDHYNDDKTFADLLCRYVAIVTQDEKYTWKIAGTLAKKLKIPLRKHKLTFKEWSKESDKNTKAWYKTKIGKQFKKMLKEQETKR